MTTYQDPQACPVEAPRLTPAIRAEMERRGYLTPEAPTTVFDIKPALTVEQVRTLEKGWANPDWGKVRRAGLFTLAADGTSLATANVDVCCQALESLDRLMEALEHQKEMLMKAYCRLIMAGQFAEAKEAVKGGVQ